MNKTTIGAAKNITINVLSYKICGNLASVIKKPPIAPPKCAVCPILPDFDFMPYMENSK